MPFPQRRYDQAFMPEMSGAMENYGCVTWTDSVLYRDPPTFAERERRALVLLHEMAHMWFGDIVTMRWWDDLWLNESFADWACSWAAEAATPFTDAWAGVTFDEIAGYAADASPISHPIAAHLPDVAAATGTFDAITYTKGQAVLKQLVAYVGEDQFLAGLRQYFAKHAWQNAAITDLVGELERASGRDLQAWTQGWLGTAGTDRLEVHRDGGDVVLRARGPEGGAPRPHSLNIGVYDEGETLTLHEKLAVETSAEATVLPDAARSGVLLVNDDDLTFACVRTDPTSLGRLQTAAGTLPTAIGRAVATTMVWDMVTRGEADAATFVHTAAQVLPSETADSVVEPLLNLVVGAVEAWTPAAERADLSSLVADLCLQVAEVPERSVVGLRGFARVATTPVQLDELTSRATDRDLRWRRLERLAALGAADRQDIDAFEREDQVPDAWLRALRARAGLPDRTAKEETWQAVFEKGEVPAHSFRLVGTQFWQPGHDQLLAPFAERFLEQLPAMAATGLLWAHALTRGMFPTTGVDGAWLERADALARSGRLAPVVANAVLERSDLTRRMWLARGGVPVSAR